MVGLAQRKYLDADAFKHEFVFQWEIPHRYVEHLVSVRTLLGRRIERIIDLGHTYPALVDESCSKGGTEQFDSDKALPERDYRIQVSAKHLTLASPVFKKMLMGS